MFDGGSDRRSTDFCGKLATNSLDSDGDGFIIPESFSTSALSEVGMNLLQLCDPEAAAVPIEAMPSASTRWTVRRLSPDASASCSWDQPRAVRRRRTADGEIFISCSMAGLDGV